MCEYFERRKKLLKTISAKTKVCAASKSVFQNIFPTQFKKKKEKDLKLGSCQTYLFILNWVYFCHNHRYAKSKKNML